MFAGSKSKGGMLALDMGMGKTPVMLAVRCFVDYSVTAKHHVLRQLCPEKTC